MLWMTAIEERAQPWRPDDTFAARLVLVRHQTGLSQQEAAEMSGIPHRTWEGWEQRPERIPANYPEVCRRISAALGVDYGWLMMGDELTEREGGANLSAHNPRYGAHMTALGFEHDELFPGAGYEHPRPNLEAVAGEPD